MLDTTTFYWNDCLVGMGHFEVEDMLSMRQQLQLTRSEAERLDVKYTHPHALHQWLASRCLLEQLFEAKHRDFKRNEAGSLYLPPNNWQVSVSHSAQWVATVKSKQAVGIDIQVPNKKLERIAAKYIASEQLKSLQQSPHYVDYLHYYWGIKEAMFKAYAKGKVDFIKHLFIDVFEFQEKGKTLAYLRKKEEQVAFNVFFQKTSTYYLCVVQQQKPPN